MMSGTSPSRKRHANNDDDNDEELTPPSTTRLNKKIRGQRDAATVATTAATTTETTTNDFARGLRAMRGQFFAGLNATFRDRLESWNVPPEGEPYDENNAPRPAYHLDDANEYIREANNANYLYDTVVGSCILAAGQDDCGQLGLANVTSAGDGGGDDDDDDEEGVEEKQTSYPPELIRALKQTVRHVAAGGMHSLACTDTGAVYSWGSSDDGALGRSAPTEKLQVTPGVVTGFNNPKTKTNEDGTIVAVAAGAGHCLFLTQAGNVYMCGMYKDMDSGKYCQSGLGCAERPEYCELPKPAMRIACGGSFNAVLLQDRSVVTFGFGNKGELARSAEMTNPDAATGEFDLGKPYFYRDIHDENGELVNQKPILSIVKEHFLKPKPVLWSDGGLPQPKRQVLFVACGAWHLLVTARDPGQFDSRLYTSGLNNYGQLGHGDLTERHALTPVTALDGTNIVTVAGGQFHSLALNLYGDELYSFGRSDYGQLGRGRQSVGATDKTPKMVPFPARRRVVIAHIAAGESHSMAVTRENEIYTWGFNESGATGHAVEDTETGESLDVNYPRKLDLLERFRKTTDCRTAASAAALHVRGASGGSQHSLFLVKPYAAAASAAGGASVA